MKKYSLGGLVSLVLLAVCFSELLTIAHAAASCVWTNQTDGSQWGTCVGDDGKTFCQSCKDGKCSVVKCSS
jgi:hypothetical protein